MLAEFIKLPKEGDSIGPYILRQNLSTSILGSFYQATHKLKHENVLLHILPEALMRADTRFQQKYKKCIEQQKELSHPSVMSAIEMHRISGNLIIQYPKGNYRSINEIVLNRAEPMPESQIQDLLWSMGKGLEDAVKIGQGHYFLSPDFLFVNEDWELKIAGLGLFQSIAYECFERFVSGAVLPISIDKKKSFSALEILSPEIRNFKSRDLRSDFYCIGMVAYFILTGSKPLRRWATPTKARKEIGEGWDILISQCLEPKPADRFANYKSFLHDLECLDDLTAGVKPWERKTGIARILRKLPLPKVLESLRFTHLMRLILLGAAGAIVIGTASLFLEIILSDYEVDVSENPLYRVGDPAEANITIDVAQPDAQVILRGPQSGHYSVHGRTLYLKGRRGQYTMKVMAPHHRMVTRVFELSDTPFTQKVTLVPDFASVDIRGAVGTDVYVVQEDKFMLFLGTIEKNSGLLIEDKLLKGEYTLLGLHETLMPALSEEVTLSKGIARIQFTQPPKPTVLVVSSEPEGAAVYIGNKAVGLTPLVVEGLATDTRLAVRVEKEGYRSVMEDLFLGKGQRRTLDAGALVEKIGTLKFRVILPEMNPPDPMALMLGVDDEGLSFVPEASMEMSEGEHTLSLEHPDYFPLKEVVQVMDGEETEVELVLQPKPLQVNPIIEGNLKARFVVDGETSELNSKGFIEVPANRDVKVSALIMNYLTVSKQFNGNPNDEQDWIIPLKPIPGPELGEAWTPPFFSLDMTWINAGNYEMGSNVKEFRRLPNEDDLTTVEFKSGFWMSLYEVKQETWYPVMRGNPSEFTGNKLPVESVSWNDANEFCRRITEYERATGRLPEGYVYRLPTEAEWEYACRAGTESPFSFGSLADPTKGNFQGTYEPGVFTSRATDGIDESYGTRPVGSYEPNAFGLYDVHGNVAEWTLDEFWDRHPGGRVTDPVVRDGGRGYTVKGGSWEDSADRVRSAAREGVSGSSVRNSVGFRVVLGPEIGK